jgi:hypothetical protein
MTDYVDHRERGQDHSIELDDDDVEDLEHRIARRQPGGDVEMMLRDLHEMIDQARPAPLSTAVKIDRDAVLDLLEQAIERLPDDLRGARWLLKERDEFLERTRREADEILAAAAAQAERMVQRSEVLRAAEAQARRVVEQAKADAAQMRNECDDYCDERLAHIEGVLEKTMAVLTLGRERLKPEIDEDDPRFDDDEAGAPGDDDPDGDFDGHDDDPDHDDGGSLATVFFDQDNSTI